MGKVAIANAKLTYQRYNDLLRPATGTRWRSRARRPSACCGPAPAPRIPATRDVMYVEELIGPDTVNTIPPATFDAFRDHGKPRASLEADLDAAQDTMETLAAAGISMKQVTDDLVTQAVKLFAEPFDKLLNSVDAKCKYVSQGEVDPQTYNLPAELDTQLQAAIEDWKMTGKVRRLWAAMRRCGPGRTKEAGWAGWASPRINLPTGSIFTDVAADVKTAGFKHALLLGMGGSSLCPEVLRMTFGKIAGFPEMFVLDSTDPAQVKALEKQSRYRQHDLHRLEQIRGDARAEHLQAVFLRNASSRRSARRKPASRFIAVTDPGSKFEQVAQARRIPPHLPRRAEHWRALFGAVGFRHGSGRGDGHRCAQVSGSRRRDGDRLFFLPAGG